MPHRALSDLRGADGTHAGADAEQSQSTKTSNVAREHLERGRRRGRAGGIPARSVTCVSWRQEAGRSARPCFEAWQAAHILVLSYSQWHVERASRPRTKQQSSTVLPIIPEKVPVLIPSRRTYPGFVQGGLCGGAAPHESLILLLRYLPFSGSPERQEGSFQREDNDKKTPEKHWMIGRSLSHD
jgi:hypothetical protein